MKITEDALMTMMSNTSMKVAEVMMQFGITTLDDAININGDAKKAVEEATKEFSLFIKQNFAPEEKAFIRLFAEILMSVEDADADADSMEEIDDAENIIN